MKNGKYTRQDVVAIIEAIYHWKRDNVRKQAHYEIRIGRNSCSLCKLYYGPIRKRCCGCPIDYETGYTECCNTPYAQVNELHEVWEKEPKPRGFERAVQDEIDFLEKMLNKATKDIGKVWKRTP